MCRCGGAGGIVSLLCGKSTIEPFLFLSCGIFRMVPAVISRVILCRYAMDAVRLPCRIHWPSWSLGAEHILSAVHRRWCNREDEVRVRATRSHVLGAKLLGNQLGKGINIFPVGARLEWMVEVQCGLVFAGMGTCFYRPGQTCLLHTSRRVTVRLKLSVIMCRSHLKDQVKFC